MATILVVDDSSVDRALVGQLLSENAEFTIDYAESGPEALERLNGQVPDVIVTDLRMPEMDGLALVAEVKNKHPLVPVVLMTSKGSEEVAIKALEAGAASYTPKRLLAQDLVKTIRNVLAVSIEQRDHVRVRRCMTKSLLTFELENDANLVPPLIGLLQDSLIHHVVSDAAERIRIGIALEEALVNAVYHGNLEISSDLREQPDNAFYKLADRRRFEDPYQQRRVEVEALATQREVTITIRDQGPGFDPSALPDPTDPENLERAYGRGLLLIRTFMDDVRHNDEGNEITMVKRRGQSDDAA